MPGDRDLVESVRAALAAAGDAERARAQQAYMKSVMPYRGIGAPELRKVLRPPLALYRPASREEWTATVRALWDEAAYREERYAALAVARHRLAREWLDPGSLDLWRHLVVTGAWWDLVDEIAAHLVAPTLRSHRQKVAPVMRAWMTDDHLWLRRTAVLSQLGAKGETDVVLLRDAIEHNLEDRSFWLRKAIGWALRDYARTDPDWVRAEVARLGDRLSGLSRREALKHL
ncbi:DNA alkylation repair protein [Nocardioides sp. cx-173]|uniref:DNA alkylation repair protein n=1 Tax=Nocardioides sp. cx-173 TaxID=2898796 RepID=UPI001E29D7D9|nr:DNA alkylation repair protein [Nocardioides sp. cx-173]MCD4527247.1 DNA alkylation repair protein [Nocardioides sp. cx-173]UGB40376.1 DNA alkylation repair protein [Nocardioides sp. cx-173]